MSLWTLPAQAFDYAGFTGADTRTDFVGTCDASVLHSLTGTGTGIPQTAVVLNSPATRAAAGTRYFPIGPGLVLNVPAIDVAYLEGACGLTGVTGFFADPVSLPLASDDYYGVRFRGTDPSDGLTRDYEIALSGVTNSTAILTAVVVDVTSPAVTLSGAPATLSGTASFTVTATFSESVTGFTDLAGDVTVTNASATAIAGGPSVYTLTITPSGSGDVSITVPAAAAQDMSGNDNTVSNTVVIRSTTVEVAQQAIADFMLDRANQLTSNQPRLTHFLQEGGNCGAFDAQATRGSGSLDGCVSSGNLWASVTGAWSDDSTYALATVGAHYFVNPNLLIGGMLQFDHFETDFNGASGQGWLAGPYFVAKHGSQPVYFEGRLLYGETRNDLSPAGSGTHRFKTKRWLAQLRATGEFDYRTATLMPLLDFIYTEDTQRAYLDSLGNTIPAQTVGLAQLSAGLDFSMPLSVSTGDLTLVGGLTGIYSVTNGGSVRPDFENLRGRTHLGLSYGLGSGTNLRINGFYDGIGSGFESYGLDARYDMRF